MSTPISDLSTGFYYIWSSARSAWTVGRETEDSANAVIGGTKSCPYTIIVPRNFSHNGFSGPVDTVGKYAFRSCANEPENQTREIFVTKQVKYIKDYGFGNQYYLTSFVIEAGSELEVISHRALHYFGYYSDIANSTSKTLTLPSTLLCIMDQGIIYCDIFTQINYCGSLDLSLNCTTLEYRITPIVTRVTESYPNEIIFGRTALKDVDISQTCKDFAPLKASLASTTILDHCMNYVILLSSFINFIQNIS